MSEIMAQRENGKDSREEYRRVQARKKRQVEKNNKDIDTDRDPMAVKPPQYKKKVMKSEAKRRQQERYQKRQERRRRKGSVVRGMVLLAVQIIVMMVFMVAMFSLDMLPTEYLAIIGGVLVLTAAITLGTQLSGKGARVVGKVFSVILTVVMVVGSYYVTRGNTVFADVTNSGEYKLDNMVVAVLNQNSAKDIKDTSNLTFGVQYAKEGENVEKAVQHINEEVGGTVKTEDMLSMPGQAKALMDGTVDAIIYDEDFVEVMNQAVPGYADSVKVIYTYGVKTDLQDLMIDVSVQDEPFSVYISGIDVYGDLAQNSRSDVNIIATVNPKTHQILLTTTPRDYYVEIPHVSMGVKDKLTHAGIYGVSVSQETLESIYDIDIAFYARLNFTSLIDIIDIIGGVDVNSDHEFTTSKAAGHVVDIKQGMNHLNGKEALAFSRERKALPNGDQQRGMDQQKVITAIIQKMLSPTMIVKASSILDAVAQNVDTDMSTDQVRALIKQQLRDKSDWHIMSVAADGDYSEGACYSMGSQQLSICIPDETSVQNIHDLMQRVINGEVLEDADVLSAK